MLHDVHCFVIIYIIDGCVCVGAVARKCAIRCDLGGCNGGR
jgi:hypothetical protein